MEECCIEDYLSPGKALCIQPHYSTSPHLLKMIVVVLLLLGVGVHSFTFDELTKHVDTHIEEYVQDLQEWVAVQSVSSDRTKRSEVQYMMNVVAKKLLHIGGKVELVDIGMQKLPDGSTIPLPNVVLAQFGSDASKLTVCVYGHADVQPAQKEDGWSTDPFNLTDIKGNMYGRGATDDKGQVLAWIHAVEAYLTLQIDLPVNVKFIIEGMEEVGSNGLDAMIEDQKDKFFSDVDYFIVSDSGWLSTVPALTYGTRGNCYFFAEVKGPKQDLHSGGFGGTVIEPMTDLIGLLDTLISPNGTILIPGISDAVIPFTDDERKLYEDIEFDIDNYKDQLGIDQLMYNEKVELLAHRWRYPTVSIHGIEGAFSAPGSKTVIPAKVTAKFSIRQVPEMDPAVTEKQVKDHLHSEFAKRNSPNKLNVTMSMGAKAWLADPKHALYQAGKAAVERVFHVQPNLIREGGTIPTARTFQDVLHKSTIMLPIGGFDDSPHSQNEKISRYNYIEGTKLCIVYMYEVAQIKDSS